MYLNQMRLINAAKKPVRYAIKTLKTCCAIEDSTTGVQAAKAAGLYTIAYVPSFSMQYHKKQSEILLNAGADQIIEDLGSLQLLSWYRIYKQHPLVYRRYNANASTPLVFLVVCDHR